MRFSIRKNKAALRAVCRMAASVALFMVVAFGLSPVCHAAGDDASGAAPAKTEELTARSVFEKMQAPALEILGRSTRLDMLDYWDADSVYLASNALGGLSSIKSLDRDYMKVEVTPVSSFEIKLLPGDKEKLVMTIYTVGDSVQAADSQVEFYDSSLRKLDSGKYLRIPDLKDFFEFPKGSVTTMKEIREMIPFSTVEYMAGGDNNSLRARLTIGDFLNTDDYNIVKLFLKPEIRAEWKGKYKFK